MNYRVYANGTPLRVRTCRIFPKPYNAAEEMEYVTLAARAGTELVIESGIAVETVTARPLSAGVRPKIEDGRIILAADRPLKLSVEINGGCEHNLMIFVEAERETPFEKDGCAKIFRSGVHDTGTVLIDQSHTTVYLEDGAVLNGNIIVKNCDDITVCGRGIVCMEQYTYEMRKEFARSIDVINCTNVRIFDITIQDSNDWSLRLNGCNGVRIENIKIFGCRGNSDGIDVCGSKNVVVTDIFTRVWDDSFVVKALDTGNCENIVFQNSVLWNDFARPMEVGVELRADEIRNIRFENIDIIHSSTGYPLMGIHHGDHARVSDVVFKNIRIEDTPGAQLFDIRIARSFWNRDTQMGDIRNITFSDIHYIGTEQNKILLSNSRIEGYSSEHDVQNVRFHHITLGGRAAKTAEALGLDVRGFVKNVSVTSPPGAEEITPIFSEIATERGFALCGDGLYRGGISVKLTNSGEAAVRGTAWLSVSPKNAETERELRFELPGRSAAQYSFDMTLQPGKHVFFLKCGDAAVENQQHFVQLDLPVFRGKKADECPLYRFLNYYGTDCAGVRIAADRSSLILMGEFEGCARMDFVLYTARPAAEEAEGEVVFSAEETDFGEVCALVKSGGGLAAAPQLRCPAEITYVFKNEPKVGEIRQTKLTLEHKTPFRIPFRELGLDGESGGLLLELAAEAAQTRRLRYPYTLFRSTMPAHTAHMFGRVKIIDGAAERVDE